MPEFNEATFEEEMCNLLRESPVAAVAERRDVVPKALVTASKNVAETPVSPCTCTCYCRAVFYMYVYIYTHRIKYVSVSCYQVKGPPGPLAGLQEAAQSASSVRACLRRQDTEEMSQALPVCGTCFRCFKFF